ncbi:MAG: hypothetical protein MJ250_02865 [Alphaproteobacteria bacterium]|nr:hypothetical protein [Alphaproteobacteria bacterium]
MTISTSTNKIEVVCSGETKTFNFPYYFLEQTDLKVYIKVGDNPKQLLTKDVDYSISGTPEDPASLRVYKNGADVILTNFPTAGTQLIVIRNVEFTQLTDYVENDKFPAELHEQALDKLTMLLQQLKETLDRAVAVDIFSDVSPEQLVEAVERVYRSIDNIDINANNIESINTNADIEAEIQDTASIKNEIVVLSEIKTKIENLSDHSEELEAIYNNISEILEAVGIKEDIVKVSGIKEKVSAVADNEDNINAVSNDLESIKDCAEDLDNINAAPSAASSAQDSKNKSFIWAEGTDEQVQGLGGEHSAKGWAAQAQSVLPDQTNHEGDTLVTDGTLASWSRPAVSFYNVSIKYKQNDVVLTADSTGLSMYRSLQNDNIGHGLDEANFWKKEDLGGVGMEPSHIINSSIKVVGNTVKLKWTDPADTFNKNGQLMCSWKGTRVVKKQGSYPKDEWDGTLVVDETVRNTYQNTEYEDTQENADQWCYKAFPYSAHDVYCRHSRNNFGVYIFAYCWDMNNPDPNTCITYPEDADNANFEKAYQNWTTDIFTYGGWKNAPFFPKACALSPDGTVAYYLDPNDYTKKADGSASDVLTAASQHDYNFMMEWDTIYRKKYTDGAKVYCYFSNKKLDDSYECWSTKLADGSYADHFYTSIFQCALVSSKLRSICCTTTTTTVPPNQMTAYATTGGAANERNYASANGVGWDIGCASDSDLIIDLFLLMFKNTNSQAVLGTSPSSTTALTLHNGRCLKDGLFHGRNGAHNAMFGMENWFSHRWNREVGVINKNGTYFVKHTYSTIDGSTAEGYNLDGTGYKNTGISVPAASQSYIVSEEVYDGSFLPKSVTGGSATTYTCDGMWSNNGQIDVLLRGGDVDGGTLAGVLCFYVADLASISYWAVGASLSYHSR